MRKFLIILLSIFAYFIAANHANAFTITSPDVSVSAYIGTQGVTPVPSISPTPPPSGKFSIFGYTSPGAKVNIENPGMYIDTTADATGYFEFGSYFSRLMVEDICLVAQDELNRVSPPVCIPPIPPENTTSIGPVIMPPTISLNNDSFYAGDQINLTGQATPNTEIKLSLFTDESKSSLTSLLDTSIPTQTKILLAIATVKRTLNPVKPVVAASLPKQDIKVDKFGKFSLTLPSEDPQYFRTFGQTVFEKAFSPKSVTLNFDIFPGWFIIMKFILGFLLGLKSRLFEIVLFGQVLIITYFLFRHFSKPHQIARVRALALREHPLPMLAQHALLIQEKKLLELQLALRKIS